jgi:hypothetical protein
VTILVGVKLIIMDINEGNRMAFLGCVVIGAGIFLIGKTYKRLKSLDK